MGNDNKELKNRLRLSSIPLRKLDEQNMPVGLASGCIIDYLSKRIILSVFHATKADGDWAVQVKYIPSTKQTEQYRLGYFNNLTEMSIDSPNIKNVDFCYCELPSNVNSYYQEITTSGEVIKEEAREVFQPDFTIQPTNNETYGFSGQILHEYHDHDQLILRSVMVIYDGLKYVGTEDSYYVFELPFEHPGHEFFKGCSGAPILDSRGNIVALVCSGDIDRNAIIGISLNKYKIALDVTFGNMVKEQY